MSAAFSTTNYYFMNALLTPSHSGGAAQDPSYPTTNLRDPDPSLEYRWTLPAVATTAYPNIDYGPAGMPANANFLALMNVRIDLAITTAFAVQIVNTLGAQVFLQGISLADLVPIPGTTDRFNLAFLFVPNGLARHVRLRATLSGVSTGWAGVGVVWCGPALSWGEGLDADWNLGFVDPSEVERSRTGAASANILPRRRKLSAMLTVQEYDETMGTPGSSALMNLRQMLQEAGKSKPVVLMPRDDNTHAMQTLTIYGLLNEVSDIGHTGSDYFNSSFDLEEIR